MIVRAALPLFALLSFAAAAHAELAPGSYDKLRKEAPEVLIIEVTGVTESPLRDGFAYEVEAKVLRVEKSGAKLKKGDTIKILYTVPGKVMPGPRPVPKLEKGEVRTAFLKLPEDAKMYAPAAFGLSFSVAGE